MKAVFVDVIFMANIIDTRTRGPILALWPILSEQTRLKMHKGDQDDIAKIQPAYTTLT